MKYIEYTTQTADRWDLLSWRFYGTPYGYERIILANPTVAITPILTAGVKLAIPVLDAPELDSNQLPPWKR